MSDETNPTEGTAEPEEITQVEPAAVVAEETRNVHYVTEIPSNPSALEFAPEKLRGKSAAELREMAAYLSGIRQIIHAHCQNVAAALEAAEQIEKIPESSRNAVAQHLGGAYIPRGDEVMPAESVKKNPA